jgi:hypothetical protein
MPSAIASSASSIVRRTHIGLATRYDKLIESCAAIVLLACIQSGLGLPTRPNLKLTFES